MTLLVSCLGLGRALKIYCCHASQTLLVLQPRPALRGTDRPAFTSRKSAVLGAFQGLAVDNWEACQIRIRRLLIVREYEVDVKTIHLDNLMKHRFRRL
ncbi:hypothetical protein MFRU_010g01040 [Monilinia fructicola]|nr:hypothetical protein MFRU_010g01040 [Monilinia fructicola]